MAPPTTPRGQAAGLAPRAPSRSRAVPLALGVAVLAISFAGTFFREAAPTHPLVAAGLRLALVAVLLAPAIVRAARASLLDRRFLRHAALGGVAYAVHFGAWVASLGLTSVAASVTLVTASPLILALIALATGRDRPTPRIWLGLAVAVVGLALVGGADLAGNGTLAGAALALLGAAAIAVYLLLGRALGDRLDALAFSGLSAAGGAVLLLGVALALGIPLAPPTEHAATFIVLTALVPHLVGHSLLTWSLRHTTPTVVGVATLGEPVGAAIVAWLWLGEVVTPLTAAGCAVTLAGVAVAVTRRRPARRPAAA